MPIVQRRSRRAQCGKHQINMGVTKDDKTLIYSRTFFFGGNNSVYFAVKTYEPLKELFDAIHKADNHMITLKQIAASN